MSNLDLIKLKQLLEHDIEVLYSECIEYMQLTQHSTKQQIKALQRRKSSLLKVLNLGSVKNV